MYERRGEQQWWLAYTKPSLTRSQKMTALLLSWHHMGGMLLQQQGCLIFTSPDGYLPTYLHTVKMRKPQNKAILLWTPLQARYMPQLCLMFDDVSPKDLEPLIRIDKQEFCLAIVKFTGWYCLWAEWELKGLQAPRRKWVCFWISQHWDYSWNLE